MWVRTSDHLVLLEPVLGDGPQVSQGSHSLTRVEDVVNHALKVVGVVGVWHHFGGEA